MKIVIDESSHNDKPYRLPFSASLPTCLLPEMTTSHIKLLTCVFFSERMQPIFNYGYGSKKTHFGTSTFYSFRL